MDSNKTETLVQLIKDFVAFKTVSNGSDVIKEELIDFIEHVVQEGGLGTYKFYRNGKPSMLIHHPQKKDWNFSLILHGHVDVVHANEDQYHAFVEAGRVHGRGTLDMKGSVAVFVLLMKDLFATDRLSTNVAVMLTSDEEQGGVDGTKYLFDDENITSEFFITGEPTDLYIVNKHKGVWRSKITIHGTSAHSSTPWLGENSLHKISKYISEYVKKNPQPQSSEWKSTYSFNKIESGDSINKIPDVSSVWVDIRYTSQDELNILINNLRDTFIDAEIETLFTSPPLDTTEENKWITELNDIIHKKLGNKSALHSKEYATDARYASLYCIPAIVFGPKGDGIHEVDEYVEIESLENYYEILDELCKTFK